MKLAVASSSKYDWVGGFLELHGLSEYFPIIFTADDVEEVKPNPALYLKALAALGVQPDEAIAIEDSANGSLAAIRAGIHCVIIPTELTKSLQFHEKAHLIDSFADFDLGRFLQKEYWEQA
ncbi:HAD-IA family hydrolase [Bacillus sp. N9]